MTVPDRLIDKNGTLLKGTESLDLYLKEISRNLGTMMDQASMCKLEILEMKKQLHEHLTKNSW